MSLSDLFKTYREIIINILTFSSYIKDKQIYASTFVNACHELAFWDVFADLGDTKMQEIKDKISKITNQEKNPQEVENILVEYIQPRIQDYAIKLREHFTLEVQESVREMMPNLLPHEQHRLNEYLKSCMLFS